MLREGRYRGSLRKKLSTAVAELNQLAGWMAYDVGDSVSGRRHLQNAMHQCQDVGDGTLAAEMLAGMSHQAAFLRSAALATDLARAAKGNAKRVGIPALVSESAVMEAHGLALMSDMQAAWPSFGSLNTPLRLRRTGIDRSGLPTSTALIWRRSSDTASVTSDSRPKPNDSHDVRWT